MSVCSRVCVIIIQLSYCLSKIKHLNASVNIDLNIETPSTKDITMTQIIKYIYQASGIKLNI